VDWTALDPSHQNICNPVFEEIKINKEESKSDNELD